MGKYSQSVSSLLCLSPIRIKNPDKDFRPSCGKITLLHVPGGPQVRFDTALYQDYTIPPFYDSMVGKLIVCAQTREEAIRKSKGMPYPDNLNTVTAPLA